MSLLAEMAYSQCVPTTLYPQYMGIRRVTLNTLNYYSGGNSRYGNFTNQSTDLVPGQTYTIALEGYSYQQYASVYIDFNGNNTFEASERVVTNMYMSYNGSASFTVPTSGITVSSARMRIKTDYYRNFNTNYGQGIQTWNNPCATARWGETEDYTVNLGVQLSAQVTNATCSDVSDGSVSLTAQGGTQPYSYNYSPVSNLSPGTYSYSVTDANGYTSSVSVNVGVTDNVAPVITLNTGNESYNLGESYQELGATASDNCGDVTSSIVIDNSQVNTASPGSYQVFYNVIDGAGNAANQVVRTINVYDVIEPTVITQDLTVELDSNGNANISPSEVDNGSTDDSVEGLNYTLDIDSFDCNDLGENQVTLTVSDQSGNQASANATITVQDNTAPIITLNGTENINVIIGTNFNDPGVTTIDSCPVDLLTTGSVDINTLGVYTLTYQAQDAAGNDSEVLSRTVTVMPVDTTVPTVITKNITVYLDNNGIASITPEQIDNGSYDNFGLAANPFTLDITDFNCTDIGAQTVTLTVSDPFGNSNTAQATVTIVDQVQPDISGPDDIFASFDSNVNGAVVTYTQPTANDQCGAVTLTQISGLASGSTFPAGLTSNIFRATDASGNNSYHQFDVLVSADYCAIPNYGTTQGIALLQLNTGFSNSSTFVSTYQDFTNLTFQGTPGNSLLVYVNVPSSFGVRYSAWIDINGDGTFDASEQVMSNEIPNQYRPLPIPASGITVSKTRIRFKAERNPSLMNDPCNVGVGEVEDYSIEFTAPNAKAKNITAELGSDGTVTIDPSDINNGSTTGSGALSFSLDKTTFDCDDLGVQDVILTATSSSGLSDQAYATVTVVDNQAPSVTLNGKANITIRLNDSYTDAGATATDNCAAATVVMTGSVDNSTVGVYTLTYKAVDGSGNESAAVTRTVTVQNIAPTFTSTPITSIGDNQQYSYAISTEDGDGDAVTVSASQLPSWLSLGTSGAGVVTLGGSSGFENGPIADAKFSGVVDATVDNQGNVYFADAFNHMIRKMTPDGIVSTLAGSGVSGYQDGPGATAQFSAPWSLDVDPQGNVYVADQNNQRIRKVAPDGTVTTLAGNGTVGETDGNGTNATFRYPAGIAVDDNGVVYVSRRYGIAKIDVNGDVTTYVGGQGGFADGQGAAAKFLFPQRLDVDPDGNLIVPDNGRIRKVTPSGLVTTLAGTGATGYLDGSALSAQFNGLSGVAVDGAGNIFISDQGNRRIRKLDSDGNVTTAAGNGVNAVVDGEPLDASFSATYGIGIGETGDLYIVDYNNALIRALSAGTTSLVGDPIGNAGTHTVTLDADDGFGGTAQQTFNITVNDVTAPTVVTQNITVELDANGEVNISPQQIDNGSSDSEGITSLTLDVTSFSCATLGAQTVNLTAQDASGNSASATATVNVEDNIAPSITLNGDATVYHDAYTSYTDLGATAADNCSATLSTTDDVNVNVVGTYTVTYTATDPSGNETVETRTVIVQDVTNPVVVTQDITVELDANGNASITPEDVDNGSSDDSGNVTLSLDRTDFDCSDLLGNSLNFDGEDDNVRLSTPLNIGQGNSTVEAWVKVPKIGEGGLAEGERVGIILGNFSSPNNINYEIHALGQVRFYWNNSEVDAYGTRDLRDGKWHHLAFVRIASENRFIAYIDGEEEFNLVQSSSQVTFSSTHRIGGDNRGNPPNFHGNIDEVRVWNYARTQAEIESEMLDALKGTESGLLNYWNFEEGTGSSLTDLASGNTGTLNLMDASSDWEDGAPNNILIPVELTATDNNNASSATALVRLKDAIAPVVTPSDITVSLDAQGSASISVADVESMITDNCEIACIELSQTNFDCDNLGTNTVSLTVMDNSFNKTVSDITVIVTDESDPVITLNGDAIIYHDAFTAYTDQGVNIDDNCSTTLVTTDDVDVNILGSYTVTHTATDAAGNEAVATRTVIVQDVTNPVAVAQDITIQLDANGNATITPEQINNGSSDDSGNLTLSLDITEFDCDDVGQASSATPVTYLGSVTMQTYGHGAGFNPNTNEFWYPQFGSGVVYRYDLDHNLLGSFATGQTQIMQIWIDTDSETDWYSADRGESTVTRRNTNGVVWSYSLQAAAAVSTDANYVYAQGEFLDYVVVLDKSTGAFVRNIQLPGSMKSFGGLVIANGYMYLSGDAVGGWSNYGGYAVIHQLDLDGNYIGSTGTNDRVYNLAFDGENVWISKNSATVYGYKISDGNSFGAGGSGIGVTLTVTDPSGNTASAIANVTVEDNVLPIVVTQDISVDLDANGSATITADQIDNGSSDNCAVQSVELDVTSFSCDDLGANTVTLTVTDVNGNEATGTATVTVNDVTPPTVITKDITVALDASGNASIIPSDVDNGSDDNCAITSLAFGVSGDNGGQEIVPVISGTRNGRDLTGITYSYGGETKTLTPANAIGSRLVLSTLTAGPSNANRFWDSHYNSGMTEEKALGVLGDFDLGTVLQDCGDPAGVQHDVMFDAPIIPGAGPEIFIVHGGLTQDLKILDTDGNVVKTLNFNINNSSSSVTIGGSVIASRFHGFYLRNNVNFQVQQIGTHGNTQNRVLALDLNASEVPEIGGIRFGGGSCNYTYEILGFQPETGAAPQLDFTCENLGENIVTLQATDASGNVSTEIATVTIVDQIAPTVVSKPISVTLTASGTVSITPQDVLQSGSDNCGPVTYTVSQDTFGANDALNSPVTIQLTGTDPSGNETTVPVQITVIDPVPTVITQDITVYLDANGQVTIAPEDVDNGSSSLVGLSGLSLDITVFGCNNVGENTVTLTATSTLGNSASETATVTVVDNILPTVLTQNLTVDLSNGGALITPAQVNNGSSDNCSIQSITLDKEFFTCEDLGENTVTLTVTDVNGNSASGTATITVRDVTMPYLNVINRTFGLDGNGQLTITPETMYNSSNDDCGGPVVVTIDRNSFDCTNLGDNIITVTSTDVSGNQNIQQAVLTIVDAAEPEVHVKEIHTVYLDESGQATLNFEDIDMGTRDNCGIDRVEISRTTFNCDDIGSVVVTTRAYDVNGNMDVNAGQTVIIVEDPIATTVLTKNITIDLDANGNASITPDMVDDGTYDNCSFVLSLSKSTFDCSNVGDNIVRLIATSNSGFSGAVVEAEAVVTVRDVTVPEVITQPLTVQLDADGNASITTEQVNAGSNDACGIASFSLNQYDFDCSNVGTNTVTLTVTDVNGNESTAQATITVEDNVAPVFLTRESFIIYLDENGVASLSASDFNLETIAEACGIDRVELSKTTWNCDEVGFHEIQVTAYDVHGNQTTAPADVEVRDEIAPTVITQNITVDLDENGYVAISPEMVDNGTYDNCSFTLSLNITEFGCAQVGENVVELTAHDQNGVFGSALATVTVRDVTAAQVLTQDITIELDVDGNASITTTDIDNGSSDACGIAEYALSQYDFDCSHIGENAVTLTVTDVNGNVSTATATVTVEDNIAPVALTQNVVVQLDASGNGSTSAEAVNNGSNDACGIAGLALSQTNFDCSHVGDNTVTLTVTDVNGNVSTATATVTVEDNIAPVALAQNVVVQLDASGNGSTSAEAVNNGSNDACGIASLALSQTNFDCSNVGANTVTLTVTDNNGNISTTTATVTVEDNIAAEVITQDIVVDLDALGNASITPEMIDNGSSDACGIASLELSQYDFDCSHVGANTVTLTVTDNNGNISTGTATVTVEDNIAAQVITQDITVELDANGSATITTSDIDNGSNDACGIASYDLDITSFDCSHVGANTVTLTVTDVNGNVSSNTATVTVVDVIAPTVITQDITVQLDANGEASITTASVDNGTFDNCTFTLSLDNTSFDCSNVGANTVTLTATDASGNVGSATATVTVEDTILPTVVPQNIDVYLDESGNTSITVVDVDGGTYDNCGVASVTIDINSFDCSNLGENTVTLTATDVNGNVSTGTATVTVIDNIAPTVNANDIALDLDENGQASFTAEDVLIYTEDDIDRDTECDVTDGGNFGMFLKKYIVGGQTANTSMGINTENILGNSQPSTYGWWNKWTDKWKGNGGNDDDDDDKGKGDDDDDDDKGKVRPKDTWFNFTSPGVITKAVDGTASVTGLLQSSVDPTDQWEVSLDLGRAYTWEEWKAKGKTFKGEWWQVWTRFKDWTYYELQSGTLTGAGRNAGETIAITPAHRNFGFQLGNGANLKNHNYGMGGWFEYPNRKGDEQDGYFSFDIDNCGLVPVPEGTVYTDDNCSIVATSLDVSDFTCLQLGQNTVNVSVTDQSGNTSTIPINVTINDHIAPVAVATNITVSLGADGTVTVDPAELDGGSTDNTDCPLTFTLSQATFDCSDIGKGSYYYDDHDCDDDRHWNKKGKGHYSHKGYGYGHYKHKRGQKHRGHKVTLTVTDAAGNSSSTEAYIEVVDDMAPTFDQSPITMVVYNEEYSYKVKVRKGRRWKWETRTKVKERFEYLKEEDVAPMVTDNCGVKDIDFDKTKFGVVDAGINQVAVWAKDYSGNTSTGTVNVNVIDITDLGRYVDMCYKGRSFTVKQNRVQDMIRRGATLGDCGANTNMTASEFSLAEPATEELFVPELALEAYPNPSSGLTMIKISSNISGPARVALMNTSGIEMEEIFNRELEANTEVEVAYDVSAMPSGMYIIRLVTAGEVRNLKLMVKK